MHDLIVDGLFVIAFAVGAAVFFVRWRRGKRGLFNALVCAALAGVLFVCSVLGDIDRVLRQRAGEEFIRNAISQLRQGVMPPVSSDITEAERQWLAECLGYAFPEDSRMVNLRAWEERVECAVVFPDGKRLFFLLKDSRYACWGWIPLFHTPNFQITLFTSGREDGPETAKTV